MAKSDGRLGVVLLASLCVVLALAACAQAAPAAAYTVHNAHRAIYARDTQLVRHRTVFEVTRKENEPFKAALMPGHVALVRAYGSTSEDPNKEGAKRVPFRVSSSRLEEYRGEEYEVYDVDTSELDKKRFFLVVESTYAGVQTPFPREIAQGAPQYTKYTENSLVPSAYPIEEQTTSVFAAFVEEYEVADPASINQHGQSEQELAMGPYYSRRAWMNSPMKLHLGNSAGFIFANQTREVEVSHWGNVAIEEHFDIENRGAKLKGQFSRLNWMHGAHGNSVNQLVQFLPIGAYDAYYRDQIGNISSSHIFTQRDGIVKLEITPRFMLFGGWKIDWLSGYNLPSHYYLSRDDSGKYVLSIPFTSGLADSIVEELSYSVILPEGATDVDVIAPYPISEVTFSLRKTYLDTTGRVVASFSASNIIAEQNDILFVTYKMPAVSLYREPLMLIAGFFAVFLVAIFYFRCDVSISPAASS